MGLFFGLHNIICEHLRMRKCVWVMIFFTYFFSLIFFPFPIWAYYKQNLREKTYQFYYKISQLLTTSETEVCIQCIYQQCLYITATYFQLPHCLQYSAIVHQYFSALENCQRVQITSLHCNALQRYCTALHCTALHCTAQLQKKFCT